MKNTHFGGVGIFYSQFSTPIARLAMLAILSVATPVFATPIIFSSTESAQAGDLLGVQGAFGSTPSIVLTPVTSGGGTGTAVTLTAQNSSGAFVSGQIPTGTALGLFEIYVHDATGQSAVSYVNRARITSCEFPEVDPGRTFRLFGRNLVLTGATPTVNFIDTVGGATTPGTIVSGGTSYVVSVVAPSSLTVGHSYQISYSNGFGSTLGVVTAPVPLAIRAGGTDSFGLNIPWGSDFSSFASNVYNVKSDSRLGTNLAYGDGVHDDTAALQNAITVASGSSSGGGVVYLPAGTYLISSSLTLWTHVVIEGAGQTSTTISTGAVAGAGIIVKAASSEVGVQNLTIQNTATITTATFVYLITAATDTSEMFVNQVTLNGGDWATGGIWMATATGNRFLVSFCTIENLRRDGRTLQLKGYGGATNSTQYVYFHDNIIPNFNIGLQLGSQNTIYEHNTLTFDGTYYQTVLALQNTTNCPGLQSDSGVQNRINVSGPNLVVLNNTFQHTGDAFVPQNDGENILAEDLTGTMVNSGVASATATTLTDPTQSWTANALANYNVVIVAGTGLGEMGVVASNTATALTMTANWPVTPDSTSKYVLCRLNVPHLLVDGNTMTGKQYVMNLFQGGYDVAIVNNTATNSQDLYLRSLIQPGDYDDIMYDVLCAGNTITATVPTRPSCIDCEVNEYYNPRFGSAAFLVEVRRNNVTALTGEAYRMENFFQNGSGEEFNLAGDAAPYGFEGMIFDGNTASTASTAYGWNPGSDGLAIVNYTDTNVYRDMFDLTQRDGNWVGTPNWGGGSVTMSGTNYLNLSYYFAGTLANVGTLYLPGTMTVEGNFTTTATNVSILSNRPMGDAVVSVSSSGKLSVYGAGFTSGSLQSPHAVNDGNPHHFAWVSYSSVQPGGAPSQLLYLDGALVNSSTTYVRPGSIGQGWIGSDTGNTTNFIGTLSGIRVWSTARTATQVASDSGLNFCGDEPGLIQLWRFNETSGTVAHNDILSDALADGLTNYWTYDDDTGTTVTDSIGGNNGTISGTPNWTTGYFGYALAFDGSTNYVTVPAPSVGLPPWQGTNGLTVHARVYIGSINAAWNYNSRYMLNCFDPANPNDGWYLGTYATMAAPTQVGFIFERGTVGSTPVGASGTTNLAIDTWYDVTATYTPGTGTIALYVNGVLQATQSNPRALQPSAAALIMGMCPTSPTNTAHYFNGIIDDVKIYDYPLSASEVEELDQQ